MRASSVLAALAAALISAPASLYAQSPQGHGIAGFWSMAPGPTPPRRAATPAEAELIAQFREGALVPLPSPPDAPSANRFDANRAADRLRRVLGDERPHPVDSAANDSRPASSCSST